jgi:plastocyanin
MKRREFFQRASLGSAGLVTLAAQGSASAQSNGNAHHHAALSGPLATATVSFGAWASGVSRRPNIGATAGLPNNVHALIPNEVKIKAGGTVNYIIAGFHVVAVYGNSKRPQDIRTNITSPPHGATVPPIIEDPADRVYRGIDPTVLPFLQGPQQPAMLPPGTTATFQPVLQDRVEVVHFPEPGRYLVICAVLPHFNEGMYGYVDVIP